jgi:hypothetical protein
MSWRVLLVVTAVLIPVSSDAIVVRHDRDDAAFLDLADTYRCTVTFKDSDPAGRPASPAD